ncbi:MAG: hypothetical protein PHZ19_06235 [Candidatus Thermoplasmatota archaeon]|nr:hypothetical protein [Candidatus Thermoplasmatota archaeon]
MKATKDMTHEDWEEEYRIYSEQQMKLALADAGKMWRGEAEADNGQALLACALYQTRVSPFYYWVRNERGRRFKLEREAKQ